MRFLSRTLSINPLTNGLKCAFIAIWTLLAHIAIAQTEGNPVLDLIDFETVVSADRFVGVWELDTSAYIYTDSIGKEIFIDTTRDEPDHLTIWQIKQDGSMVQYYKPSKNWPYAISDLRVDYQYGGIKVTLLKPKKPYSDSIGTYYYSKESTKNKLVLYQNCYTHLGDRARIIIFKRVKTDIKFKGMPFPKKKMLLRLVESKYKDNKYQNYGLDRGFEYASSLWTDIEIHQVDKGRYHLKAIRKEDSKDIILEFYDKRRLKNRKFLKEPM